MCVEINDEGTITKMLSLLESLDPDESWDQEIFENAGIINANIHTRGTFTIDMITNDSRTAITIYAVNKENGQYKCMAKNYLG